MADVKDVEKIFNHLMKSQPQELMRLFNDANTGMTAVLRILKDSSKPVTAGKISELMGVSEARVTALLKKMQNRGYIVKEKDDCDARITNVKLTQEGTLVAEQLRVVLCQNISTIIDTVGVEKMNEYLRLTDEINDAIRNNLPSPPQIS